VLAHQQSAAAIMAGTLPHGIFELPAVILAAALGLSGGVRLINKIRGRGDYSVREKVTKNLRFFITFIVPLLLIAAIIEVFVTPLIIAMVAA